MKQILLLHLLVLLAGITDAYGQVRLSDMPVESADSLQKNRIRYFSPGKGGTNKVWDFSRKLGSRESTKVLFVKDSTGVVSFLEPVRTTCYCASSDSLIMLSEESILEKRVYEGSKYIKKFPFEYCDSISKIFRCEGLYCGNHPFREVGTSTVKVDAVGSIVLAENDTLENVKRVHTIDTYSKCMDVSVVGLDTAKLVQVIDERYEWYLPESQYPIIEDVTSTTYFDMDEIGTTRYAYCNIPEDWVDYYITPDDDDTTDEVDSSFDEELAEPDIIHYEINTAGGIVTITYNLDADATISTIVASYMGMTYKHKEWTQQAGQGYYAQIDCNGLPSGTYILYINVNGKVYSEKITL